MTPRRVVVHHPTDDRPQDPAFQALITTLNDAVRGTVGALGWSAEFIAGDTQAPDADLVVVAGGEDVSPELYGGRPGYPGAAGHVPAADRAHLRVIRDAAASGTPLLGICRGLQLINVAFGGTLVQDMCGHRRPGQSDPFVPTRVTGDPGIVPDQPVLCTHHQAIDVLGSGLRVAARAEDGIIEAVVHRGAPVTGVQWHPEHPAVAATQLKALLLRLDAQCGAALAS